MHNQQITLRRVTQRDLDSFRAIRLEALQRHPRAYGHTYEQESAQQAPYFLVLIERNVVMGAFADGVLIGYIILSRFGLMNMHHKGTIWGAYVKPEYSHLRLSWKLTLRLLDVAKTMGMQYCVTSHFASNKSVQKLHKIRGWSELYREKNGVRYPDGTYDDIVHLVKYL